MRNAKTSVQPWKARQIRFGTDHCTYYGDKVDGRQCWIVKRPNEKNKQEVDLSVRRAFVAVHCLVRLVAFFIIGR